MKVVDVVYDFVLVMFNNIEVDLKKCGDDVFIWVDSLVSNVFIGFFVVFVVCVVVGVVLVVQILCFIIGLLMVVKCFVECMVDGDLLCVFEVWGSDELVDMMQVLVVMQKLLFEIVG